MRPHHTKNKGDLGVLHAKVDLAEKGYRLLLPLSEHEPFDLVAYNDGEAGMSLRISAPRNFQKKHIRWAKDFTEIPKSVRGVSNRA